MNGAAPTLPATGRCRSCGAPIRWELSPKGRRIPISLATGESHFADCPDARQWSKGSRKPPTEEHAR